MQYAWIKDLYEATEKPNVISWVLMKQLKLTENKKQFRRKVNQIYK